ncbi:MAG: hypothetical protein ABI743_12770, partial [bacterium]
DHGPTALATVPAPVIGAGHVADTFAVPYTITIDPETLQATAEPSIGRSAEAASQAFSYDLDLAAFLKPDTFRIARVKRLPSGDLNITFRHKHPFPGVDVNAAAIFANRADLGYTGRLLILTTGPATSFFGGTITADLNTCPDADGYLYAGDLLHVTGLACNTFPYVLLADDAKDNRIGITNGGVPTGNYTSAAKGWQRSNLGVAGNGWTGYDYLHGGQTVENSFTLDQSVLTGGPYALEVALVIRYTDPKGVGSGSHRLPGNPVDPILFAYRCPHAAIDCSVIGNVNNPQIAPNSGAQATVTFDVRDWDTAAATAGDTTLADENDVTLVLPGSIGVPTVQIDCPALSATPAIILPSGAASGVPGDEIPYAGQVTNNLGTAPSGLAAGLIRVIDKDDGYAAAIATRFGVDPVTLAADLVRSLPIRTYQAVTLDVQAAAAPVISSVSPGGAVGRTDDIVMFSAVASNLPTSWSWNFGGGATPNVAVVPAPTVGLALRGAYTGSVTATNTFGTSAPFNFSYSVLPFGWADTFGSNPTPNLLAVAVHPSGEPIYVGATFTAGADLDPGTGVLSPAPGGGTDRCILRFDHNGILTGSTVFNTPGNTDNIIDMQVAVNGDLLVWGSFTGTVDFDPGPAVSNLTSTAAGVYLQRLTPAGGNIWADGWGPTNVGGQAVTVTEDISGKLYVGGSFLSGVGLDLDPGIGSTTRTGGINPWAFLVQLDAAGGFLWGDVWGASTPTTTTLNGIAVDSA